MVNPNQALWEKGDFTRIAATMRESGEALVQRIGIKKGMQILDLGCGDGTTALPAARLGAHVLGVDIARNLVEAGNKRAAEQGLTNLKFQEGDATNLEGLPDKEFDLVISIFGAMFAPKPFDVAKEMVRVAKPAGRIVMGNWIPNDPTLVAQILKISSAYTPPPPEGFVSPMTWGIENNVIERFGAAGIPKEKISFVRDTFTFNFPGTPSEYVDEFRNYYGPTMNAFEAADKTARQPSYRRNWKAVHQANRRQRRINSGDVLARNDHALNRIASSHASPCSTAILAVGPTGILPVDGHAGANLHSRRYHAGHAVVPHPRDEGGSTLNSPLQVIIGLHK
jgi:SAM-dependent methyltransferase